MHLEDIMSKPYLITLNLEKNLILFTACGPIENELVREMREEIVPLLKLFDEPVTLVVDMREAEGSLLDAFEELRKLYADYEHTSISRIVRIHSDEMDNHGTGITDRFHMKGISKTRVLSMHDALKTLKIAN
ncbi:MAG: hypothetical protein AAFX93_10280 [Verrucomicrobiota bacterium]